MRVGGGVWCSEVRTVHIRQLSVPRRLLSCPQTVTRVRSEPARESPAACRVLGVVDQVAQRADRLRHLLTIGVELDVELGSAAGCIRADDLVLDVLGVRVVVVLPHQFTQFGDELKVVLRECALQESDGFAALGAEVHDISRCVGGSNRQARDDDVLDDAVQPGVLRDSRGNGREGQMAGCDVEVARVGAEAGCNARAEKRTDCRPVCGRVVHLDDPLTSVW